MVYYYSESGDIVGFEAIQCWVIYCGLRLLRVGWYCVAWGFSDVGGIVGFETIQRWVILCGSRLFRFEWYCGV